MTKLKLLSLTLLLISSRANANNILIGLGGTDTTINRTLKNGLFAEYHYENGRMTKKTFYYKQMKLSSYDVNIESMTEIEIKKTYFNDSVFRLFKEYADTARKTSLAIYSDTFNAQYIGGESSLTRYLEENLSYPESARIRKKTGIVMIRFILSKEGVIADIKNMSSIDPELTKEAMRVVYRTDGNWVQSNKLQMCQIPITFELD